jgi:primosomal protein N' (replication factor Y)
MHALRDNDRDGLLAYEIEERKIAHMPPYGRLASLILSGTDARTLDSYCNALAKSAPRKDGLEVLGPAPAALSMLRGKHRRRFLMKSELDIHPQPLIRDWLDRTPPPKSVKIQIDIDPYSFW